MWGHASMWVRTLGFLQVSEVTTYSMCANASRSDDHIVANRWSSLYTGNDVVAFGTDDGTLGASSTCSSICARLTERVCRTAS